MATSSTPHRFTNKSALVTGAGSGIGRAVAITLATEGAFVFAADVNYPAVQSLANECSSIQAVQLDVTIEADWKAAIQQVLTATNRFDILVNSAGVSAGCSLAEMPLTEWRRVLAINLDGAFLGTKQALRAMHSSGGSIIHVSSASGIKAAGGAAAYSASKAGLCMLAKAAAKECRDTGVAVRVNTVCPAGVKTPMWTSMPFFRDLVTKLGSEEAAFASLAKTGGPFADPSDIVTAILFLASDESQFVTGVDLLVDGGYVL